VGGGAPAEGRGALLSSIAGFSKGGLKKATTVDKSSPILSTPTSHPQWRFIICSCALANIPAMELFSYGGHHLGLYLRTETEKAPPGGGGPMGGLFAGGIPKLGGRGSRAGKSLQHTTPTPAQPQQPFRCCEVD
jgi:hypothetical protein